MLSEGLAAGWLHTVTCNKLEDDPIEEPLVPWVGVLEINLWCVLTDLAMGAGCHVTTYI